MIEFKQHEAYKYALDVVDGVIPSNKYIIRVCEKFLDDIENQKNDDFPYVLDMNYVELITNMTKLINMASGLKVGMTAYDALTGFQWFFLINSLCWKEKKDLEKRRYEKNILLIGRKSGKTFLVGLTFILLMLLEPKFSEFYSVAPSLELSSIIKKEMEQLLSASPHVAKYFKVLADRIECTLKETKFKNLATSKNRMDGRKASVFVADEVGALPDNGPIEAMSSSQMNMKNRTGILISTAYPTSNNPMVEEVDYAKKVIDGVVDDNHLFALIYEPDDPEKWTDDNEILKANPLAYYLEDNMEFLRRKRDEAIQMPSTQTNFKTKHMNIFVDGDDSEVYLQGADLRECEAKQPINWEGRDVYIGVDLSLTNDNTSVSMVGYDEYEDKLLIKTWAFIPKDNIDKKTNAEKVDYRQMINQGYCFACGDRIISYKYVEDFVLSLSEKYKVNILGIGYDKYNAMSSVNRWEEEGLETIEVRQHSSVLHSPTKMLKERVLQQKVEYDKNKLFEINVTNAIEVKDTNLNSYVNKKKSKGKIDMLAATINAVALWEQYILNELSTFDYSDISIF